MLEKSPLISLMENYPGVGSVATQQVFAFPLGLATVTLKRVCYVLNLPKGILEIC